MNGSLQKHIHKNWQELSFTMEIDNSVQKEGSVETSPRSFSPCSAFLDRAPLNGGERNPEGISVAGRISELP